MRYKVTTSSPGHFFVLAHYVIDRKGKSQEIDRALPVRFSKPPKSDQVRVDGDLQACAYMSSTNLYY
jgi:hypothetical protein